MPLLKCHKVRSVIDKGHCKMWFPAAQLFVDRQADLCFFSRMSILSKGIAPQVYNINILSRQKVGRQHSDNLIKEHKNGKSVQF